MRLTENQKKLVLEACLNTRPDAVLRRFGSTWGVLWRVEYDKMVDPDQKVPGNQRWRAQLLTRIDGEGVWFSGEEHQNSKRLGVMQMAEAEASQYV
jgi:hypothetical protein